MLNEQQFEELLQIVIPEVCYEEVSEIEEQMLREGEHVFSEEFEKNMESVFKGKNSIVNEVTAKKRKTKPKFKYLLVAILLFILSSITVMAYEPAKHALKEFFFTIYDEFILFHPEKEEEDDDIEGIQMDLLKPSYIPTNYELMDEVVNEALKNIFIMWIDENENVLYYEQRMPQTGEMVLSSDGYMPTDIKIGEYDGKLISEKDGLNTIFYKENNFLFVMSGFVETDELIHMLLSLE